MGQAEQLAQAASELSSTASAYTEASGEIQRIMGLLSGVAYGLGGETSWQGQSYQAFVTAWKQAYGDSSAITGALTGAAGAMSKLSQTINEQLPAIQKAEALAQINPMSLHPAGLAQFKQDLANAQQASDTALLTIRALANSLAGTLSSELAPKVGVCDAGTGATPPTLSKGELVPVSTDYAAGFLAGAAAAEASLRGGSGGKGGENPPPDSNACSPDNPSFWQEFLQALKNNLLTPRGLAWSVGTGMAAGAMNTTNNYLSTGLSRTTLNAFAGAVMGGTFGPVSQTISQMITNKIIAKCQPLKGRSSNFVTLLNSFFGGVIIGGFGEHYTLQKVLPHSKTTPSAHPTH